jgi:threonine dehydratase
MPVPFTVDDVRAARCRLGDSIRSTPTWRWDDDSIRRRLGPKARVFAKLELLQVTGSFKPRGALINLSALDEGARARGITTVTAGNHGMAVAYAAQRGGTNAKIVMPSHVSPLRVQACRKLGAQVELVPSIQAAFTRADELVASEGRTFIHPFEGEGVALGTATIALELHEAVADLDAVIVPIGGGGLCAGIATAIKQLQPGCRVYGVEPTGADSMHRSFAAGKPASIERVDTIADSLGAPYALPYSFDLCRRHVDELVRVDDDALCRAMFELFVGLKLAVEPAGAAATAALLGPLRSRLADRSTAVIVCGANIDAERFAAYLRRGEATRNE